MTTWAIGNGESRQIIDIESLQGIKVGCNAIHRDYNIDHLVCVDKRMVSEATKNKRRKQFTIYTRKDWWVGFRLEERIRPVPELPYTGDQRPDDPWHWGSGPYAVLLATQFSDTINLLGFDLYSKNDKVNNLYKDTENYDTSEKRAVDPRYWIYQIAKVFECFPQKTFTIYANEDWQAPDAWKYSNISVDSISNI